MNSLSAQHRCGPDHSIIKYWDPWKNRTKLTKATDLLDLKICYNKSPLSNRFLALPCAWLYDLLHWYLHGTALPLLYWHPTCGRSYWVSLVRLLFIWLRPYRGKMWGAGWVSQIFQRLVPGSLNKRRRTREACEPCRKAKRRCTHNPPSPSNPTPRWKPTNSTYRHRQLIESHFPPFSPKKIGTHGRTLPFKSRFYRVSTSPSTFLRPHVQDQYVWIAQPQHLQLSLPAIKLKFPMVSIRRSTPQLFLTHISNSLQKLQDSPWALRRAPYLKRLSQTTKQCSRRSHSTQSTPSIFPPQLTRIQYEKISQPIAALLLYIQVTSKIPFLPWYWYYQDKFLLKYPYN